MSRHPSPQSHPSGIKPIRGRISGFADRHGNPLPGNALTDAFRYIKKRTGLTCRVHDLRGFVASQLLAAGTNPAEVRDIIGWRDATTLLNYYAQPTAEDGRKTIEGIAGLIAHG